MIRKIVETAKVKFSINQETGDLEMETQISEHVFSAEDATELLIELRKQQLDYLQRKQDQEESMITRIIRSICR